MFIKKLGGLLGRLAKSFATLVGIKGLGGTAKAAETAAKGATAATGAAAKGATVAAAGAAKPLSGFAQFDKKAQGLQKAAQTPGRGKLSSVTGKVKDKFAHMKQFPRLLKVAKAIPILGSVLTAGQAVMILTSDKSVNEKKKALGGLVGGTLGAAGLGMVGAAMGSVIPGPGTIIGGIIGSLLGFFSGEYIGTKLMSFLLDGKIEREKTPQTAGRGGGRAGRGRGPTATPKTPEKVISSNLPEPGQEGYDDLTEAEKNESFQNARLKRIHEGLRAEAKLKAMAEKMTPTRGAPPTTPPPVLSASNNVNAPSTTNVTQNSTSMVNKDRVIDNLNYVY